MKAHPPRSVRSSRRYWSLISIILLTCQSTLLVQELHEKLTLIPSLPRYFTRVSICMPLLDEISFKDQYRNAKERISPALLCCLYANTMSFWRFDRQLAPHRCPDTRYLWNVATEALYSELHLLPTISTIMAIMLNVGGRPSTGQWHTRYGPAGLV